jgi:hypothetical protein
VEEKPKITSIMAMPGPHFLTKAINLTIRLL